MAAESRRFGGRALVALVVLIVATAAVTPTIAVVTAQDDPPPPPAAYYGEIEINGEPAETGITIEAEIDGEVQGEITTEQEGEYGGPAGTDRKLVVRGADGDAGATVTFYVEGDNFDRTQAEPDASVEWESGDVREVDLSADVDIQESGSGGDGTGGSTDDGTTESTDDGTGGVTTDSGTEDTASTADPTSDGQQTPSTANVVHDETAAIQADPTTGQATAQFSETSPVDRIQFESDGLSGEVTATGLETVPTDIDDPPGETVSVVEITVPEEAADDPATVRLRVARERIDEMVTTPSELSVTRFSDGQWQTLDTETVSETDSAVVFEAETPGFSYFALTTAGDDDSTPTSSSDGGANDASTADVDADSGEGDVQSASDGPVEELTGFSLVSIVGAVAVVLSVLIVAVVLVRRRRGQERRRL